MAINRINETDLQDKLVSQLSNRPTDPRSSGGDNLTAQQVKARHDALGLLVKDKLNELIDALNNATVNGEPVTPLSDLITVVADGVSKSLTEWIEAKLTKSVAAGEGVHAYGVDDDGEQTMLPVSDAATEGAIPQYGTGGVLPVADGTADGHAMNKGQVDALVATLTDAIAAKYTKPDGGIPLTDLAASVSAIISDALKWSNADTSATPFKVPIRDGTGVVHGATYGASAPSTALVNKEQFEPVKALAEGANKAFSVASYSALATALNASVSTAYKVGQSIYVATEDVPDVWVYSVEDSSVSYTYTTDSAFEAALVAGTLQIGYYTLRPLETEKVDFTGYATETYVGNAISGNIDATLSTTGKSADAKAVGDAIDALIDALVDGVMAVAEAAYAESATYAQQADFANQINTDREIEDADTACPPTVFGTVGGNAEVQSGLMKFEELRGHTIKWNQHADSTNPTALSQEANVISSKLFTFNTAHKYLFVFDYEIESDKTGIVFLAGIWNNDQTTYKRRTGIVPSALKGRYAFVTNGTSGFDNGSLSDFGSVKVVIQAIGEAITASNKVTISNVQCIDLTAIYGAGNEPSTYAEFACNFPMPYYAYNAGNLLSSKSSSVDFVKRNQCPALDTFFNVLPNTEYEVSGITAGGYLQEFDGNKTLIKTSSEITSTTDITLTTQTVYAKIQATTYTDVLCYIKWETPNLPYVPYYKQHITLPNIELRSVGDVYDVAYQTGGGKRRIGERAYQSGDENDPDVSTDGTTTLYVLATETDITVEENPGWDEYADIDNFGTVKFNQDPAQTIPVPQAYFVRYTVNLVEFLDSLYVHCGGDVSKIALVE